MDIINFISENYQWVFSGIGVSIIGGFITFFSFRNRKNKNKESSIHVENKVTVNQNNEVNPLYGYSKVKESIKGL